MSDDRIDRTELDGGLRVLTQHVSGARSASVGVWVRYGSAHEGPAELGAAHLLEHMVFKGAGGRTARELALVLERLGGSLDAYTSREHTSYQARVLGQDLDVALEVVGDLVARPWLEPRDLETEREVVLEEISTVEDTPDDLVFELHNEGLWPGHPYGHSILGTRESVAAMTAGQLRDAHGRGYTRPNLILAGAGAVDHERVVAVAERVFGDVPGGAGDATLAASGGPETGPETGPDGASPVEGALTGNGAGPAGAWPPAETGERVIDRPGAQTHIVLGGRAMAHSDERRFAAVLLSNALGGGMSSRLFQRVREELGLAYAVYTFQSFYRTGGTMGVYVGTRPEWADRAVEVIVRELREVAAEGLTPEELEDAKGQLRGQIVLGLESPGGRVYRLALQELYDEPRRTVDELVARVNGVTLEETSAVAAELLDPEPWLTVRLGPTR